MDFKKVQSLVSEDMQGVNTVIRQYLYSDVALINQMVNYIIDSGGKRLRPLLAILCARACGYRGHKHSLVAAIIEFIHTATYYTMMWLMSPACEEAKIPQIQFGGTKPRC